MKRATPLICAAAAALAIAGSSSAAGGALIPGEQAVIRIAVKMGANATSGVSCVDLGGRNASGQIVAGTAGRRTGAISLDTRYTCLPVVEWWRTGRLTASAFRGLVTIGHEIAHTRGVGNEAAAECIGAQAALGELRRLGKPLSDVMGARRWLREQHDRSVPRAYRLSGITCRF